MYLEVGIMPLKSGKSHAAMAYNYRLERAHGKPARQARAIMLRKAGIKRSTHLKRGKRKR